MRIKVGRISRKKYWYNVVTADYIHKAMKKITILIPVYNEKDYIRKAILAVCQIKVLGFKKQIVVIDDGSTDGTYKEIQKSKAQVKKYGAEVKIIRFKKNKGKGAAIRAGIKKASGQIVVIQDADLEYNPKEIRRLIRPIVAGYADVVYGSRFMSGAPHRVLFFWHMIANKTLTLVSNMFTNLNLTDMETGYKVFKLSILKRIKLVENRFGFEPEVTAKIAKLNCRVYEVGISYKGRKYEDGKKISFLDGIWALWCVIKYNLS